MAKAKAISDRVTRDGQTAVLVSPGYGAGFVTWAGDSEVSPFEPKIVELVLAGRKDQITAEWVKAELGLDYLCLGGVSDLTVEWLPVGTAFRIDEYDGSESIVTLSDLAYTA